MTISLCWLISCGVYISVSLILTILFIFESDYGEYSLKFVKKNLKQLHFLFAVSLCWPLITITIIGVFAILIYEQLTQKKEKIDGIDKSEC